MLASPGKDATAPRVLFCIQRFPPAFGGGAQFLRLVRDAVAREGIESIVLTGNRGIAGGDQPGIYRLPSPGGESFPRLDAYSFALMALPALLALRRRYDLIHTMGNAHYVYASVLAGWILGKPVIISSVQNRGDDPAGIVQERFGRIKNALFSRAAGYVCCSGLQLEAYRATGYPMERVHFIPNGSDPTRFFPCPGPGEKAGLRERLGIPPDRFTVATVGVFCERKGIDFLAEAWIRFRKSGRQGTLLLVGPASASDPGAGVDPAFVKAIRDRFQEAGVADSVRFTGRVGNVEEYLRASDLFALMSRGEGFPAAILEAMSSGLPFVIWDLPDYGGYDLQDGRQGFLLPPFDVDRLVSCLAGLEGSRDRLENLAREARLLGSRYDLASSLARHAALYREIAAPRRNGGAMPAPSRT